MNKYEVSQVYENLTAYRVGRRMASPRVLGTYQNTKLVDAIAWAAREHGIAALLLQGKKESKNETR